MRIIQYRAVLTWKQKKCRSVRSFQPSTLPLVPNNLTDLWDSLSACKAEIARFKKTGNVKSVIIYRVVTTVAKRVKFAP